jgi:type II secretory pathway pseudopilin PulG
MRRPREGFTMIESCAAAAILAAALAIAVGLLTSVARQRQGASRHARAVVIADNLLQRLTNEPYRALTADRADEIRRQAVSEMLPDGDMAVRITDVSDSLPGKQIEVDVTWRAGGTAPYRHHTVATWVYEREVTK